MQVHLLTDSFFDISRGTFVPGERGNYTAASKSLLLITEKERILIDTGFGNYPKIPRYREVARATNIHRIAGQGIKCQLKKHNLTPEDITTVINTHLHTAHSGNNRLFRNAKFYVRGEEFRYVDSSIEENPDQTAYVPENFGESDYVKIKQSFKIAEGVTVVPTPGHTPGHQSVIIKRDGETLIYSGDVSPLRQNLEKHVVMQSYDPSQTLKSMESLLKVKNAKWIFSHDRRQLSLRSAYQINKLGKR